MNEINYDGNDKETYDLLLNDKVVAELLLGEDGVMELVDAIDAKVYEATEGDDKFTVSIRNDEDKLGVLVDVWEGEEHIESETFWFEDFVD